MIFTLAYTQENINKAEDLEESWKKNCMSISMEFPLEAACESLNLIFLFL